MVGLDTDHRLSLAQNPILLAGQIAILLASCNRDVARLRKRRQVAGREEVRAGDSESRAQFGRTPRPTFQIIGKLEKFSDGNCGLSASFGNIAA